MAGKRIEWLDVARGIAILLVIAGHSLIGIYCNNFIFSFHVPLFFMITGYLFRKKNIVNVLKKNAVKLLIPYYFTAIVIVVGRVLKGYFIVGWTSDEAIETVTHTVVGFLVGFGADRFDWPYPIWMAGAVWFLWALFWSNLIMQVVFHLTEKKEEWQRGLLFGLLAIVFGTIGSFFWIPTNLDMGFVAAFFGYIGYLFNKVHIVERRKVSGIVWGLVIFTWIAASMTGSINMAIRSISTWITIPGAVCGSLLTMKASTYLEQVSIIKRILSWYGANSLKIMCIHLVEMMLIPLEQMVIDAGFSHVSTMVIIGRVIISTVVTLLINGVMRLFKKNKGNRMTADRQIAGSL